ncbi:unnamed protein product [Lactuca saligna]|uniref:Uncharacterized protein n=1 Tax=Lactuca saligna TaxID=75948 RepID=A0AA35VMI3_LACSI|nr:unnamed protein product [Lactuca saligna]
MVAATNWVFHADVNETQLKALQGAIASIREELCDSEVECRLLSEQNCIVACEKAALEDHVATLEVQIKKLKSQMLEKGVVHVINKVIESTKFSSEIQGVRKACGVLGFEKGKQLGGCSTISDEFEALDPVRFARRDEEVDIALTSLAEIDFAGLFHPGS